MGKAVFIPYICALATACNPLSPKTDFGEVGVSMSGGAFGTFFFFLPRQRQSSTICTPFEK